MLLVPRNPVRLVCHSVKLFPVLCLLTAWPLSAQSVDDIFARLDKSAQGFKTLGADIKQTAEFMLREKIIKAMPDLAKVINLEFARQATANLGK